jgi:DNA-binding NtrC family response regulator
VSTAVATAVHKKVIIIEPDEAVRSALAALLMGRGWDVLALDCASGLSGLESAENVIALLCECDLPDLTAGQVLDYAQSVAVPVIFTGHGQQVQEAVDLVRLGARDFLEKPFRPNRLLSLLDGLAAPVRP